jgi:DNA-binding CsgD family transcriptional regulator
MNNAELKQLWQRAYKHACWRRHHSIADDFAQEAVIAWNRGRKATVEQLLIDFLRKEYGGTGLRLSTRRGNRLSHRSLDEEQGDTGRTLGDSIAAPEGDPGAIRDTRQYGVSLNGAEVTVFELIQGGMSQDEIGDLLGVTPSRICQIFRSVKKKTKDEVMLRDFYDTYNDFKESSELLINWIAI